MSASYNKTILAGNLTRDVELKVLGSGTPVATSCLAVNRKFKGEEQKPMFIDVTFFGKTAELASEYCHKGSNILVDGRLELDTWDDRESGAKRSKHKVIAERIEFLDKKGDGGSSRQASNDSYEPPSQDTPF